MGCSDSREDITAEEAMIINAESSLEYSHLSATHTDLVHRKYSYGGKVLEEQWKDIYKTLELAPSKSYTTQQVLNFFDKFKVGPGEYSLKKLLVFGILLSQGNSDEKAKLLFEVQDEAGSGILNKNGLTKLFEMLFEIAVEFSTKITIKDDPNMLNESDISNYANLLKKGVKSAQDMIVERLLDGRESIAIEEFALKMVESERVELLSTHGLRSFAKSFARKNKF